MADLVFNGGESRGSITPDLCRPIHRQVWNVGWKSTVRMLMHLSLKRPRSQ